MCYTGTTHAQVLLLPQWEREEQSKGEREAPEGGEGRRMAITLQWRLLKLRKNSFTYLPVLVITISVP